MQPAEWRRSARQAESERRVTEVELNDALVSMLILPSRQLERSQRWARRYFAGFTTFAALSYAATWLFAASRLWAAWQSGDWSQFWDAYWFHASVLALLHFVYVLRSVLTATIDQALAMRRGIEVSDAAIAPIAPDQPLPLSADEMRKGRVRFVSLVRPERAYARRQQINSGICFFVFGAVCAGLAALLLAVAGELALGLWLAVTVLVFFTMTLGFVAMGVLMLLRARRSLSPLNLTADEWGLAWDAARVRRRRMRIAWHEARAFFAIAEPQEDGSNRNSAYVLQGEGHRLVWMVPLHASAATLAASERLVRHIVTRTRLPLSVISAATLSPEDYDPKAPVPSSVDPPIDPRVARFLWLSWLIPMALGFLIILAGLVLSHLPI